MLLLESILQEYIYDCRLRKLSERTIKSIRNNHLKLFRYLSEEFGIADPEAVRRVHIQSYITYLNGLGRKETYVNTLIKSFRGFFMYCEEERYIRESPMKKIKFQKEEMPVIQTFTNEEVRRMVSYYSGKSFLEQRNKLIMVVLLDSGIRNSELCNVKTEDVLDNVIKIHGKGKKIRFVPLTPAINKALMRYMRNRQNYIKDKYNYQTEYLLLSQNGKKLTPETVGNVVKNCGKACHVRKELRCSPHTCRHYYAQAQLKNGCDLFTVSRLLGHNNINITRRYLNSIDTDDIISMAQRTTPLNGII